MATLHPAFIPESIMENIVPKRDRIHYYYLFFCLFVFLLFYLTKVQDALSYITGTPGNIQAQNSFVQFDGISD